MDDLTLLRKFEPVVCYTEGELFFPCAVDEYLPRCSLWLRNARGQTRQLVPEGELTVEKLAEFNKSPVHHTLYLRFIEAPLDPLEYQRWLLRPERPSFQAPGRLARVGLLSRILDAFFNLSLLLRGTVPGGTAAAAEVKYQAMRGQDSRRVYYGRVVREGGYIILHYLFFYAMNDWRSSFYGVNDHEADWEQIFVYLSDEAENEPVPCWVAYASHDFSGDDLRRRWDDPTLHKAGETHPLVFAGAGSHASYFQPGEYLTNIEPAFLRPLKKGLTAIRKFWAEQLGQGDTGRIDDEVGALLSVPFVDYARGDGRRIGPGQDYAWSPLLLTAESAWAEQYRGLWGLDTQDFLGGERAPSGPKYNRDGSVRVSWYDPLGWAGLDKVTPPQLAPVQLTNHINALAQERAAVDQELSQKREEVRLLALEARALRETDYLNKLHQARQEKLKAAQEELHRLQARAVALTETWLAGQAYLQKIESGDWGDPQAHLHHTHRPEPPAGRQARVVELWAAISGGLLLLVFTSLLVLSPAHWLTWTLLVGAVFITIEATIRGRLASLLLNVTILLAVITGLILIKDFWQLLVVIGVFALVVTMIGENLRELGRK